MTQKQLNDANVHATLGQMSGKGVPEGVAAHRFENACFLSSHFDCPLQGCLLAMPAVTVADDGGGKHKLPDKFPFGQRVLEPELAGEGS